MKGSYWITNYGRVSNPKDWYYNPNYLINRIYYIVDGTAYYKKNTRLKPGFLYLFGMDSDFRVSQSEEDPVDHVFFDFISFQTYLNLPILEIDLFGHEKLKHLILALAEEFSERECPQHIANSYFEIISRELNKMLDNGRQYSDATRLALEMIHSCPAGELSVKEVAKKVCLNENYMIRKFHAEMGVTPHRYISLWKADLAIQYAHQGKKMQEIADELGYASISSLSYAFKTTTGKNLSCFQV